VEPLSPVSNDFPHELKQFLALHIESLAQLETLLVLERDPQRQWTTDELARELYITAEMCRGICADLVNRRLVASGDSPDRYRYAPADPSVDMLVGELAQLYRERRVAVITAIYSGPVNKVQTFADAFRLRREE
jgi:hypothetical protein